MAGERFQALQNALLQAFDSPEALRELLLFKLDLKLPQITTSHSLAVMVLDVILYLESHGRLAELVAGACELRPHHRDLDDVVRRYWPEVPRPAAPLSEVRRPPMALSDNDWAMLIDSIDARKCTPVIGPGACQGVVPDTGELAAECADRWDYPFDDRTDLTRVSQFLALTNFPLLPHEQLHRRYATLPAPDFASPEEPHALLAELDLPLYITTNWDPFMAQALERRRIKVVRAFPRWNESLEDPAALGASPADTAGGALVYHLFGQHEIPESMVVTEDDCFKFFSSVVANKNMFPPIVHRALGGTSLLFIGYGVFDWGFRVLVRVLLQSLTVKNRRLGMAVQLPPETLSEAQRTQIERYLERFLNEIGQIQFRVFWGNTREFTRELRTRWEEHRRHAVAG